jgi:hypothetical protein
LRTLKEATESDWPDELEKLKFRQTILNFKDVKLFLLLNPSRISLDVPSRVVSPMREPDEETGEEFLRRVKSEVQEYMAERIRSGLLKLGDQDGGVDFTLDQQFAFDLGDTTFVYADGMHKIERAEARVVCGVRAGEVPMRRELYENVGITSAMIAVPEVDCSFTAAAIQTKDGVVRPTIEMCENKATRPSGRCSGGRRRGRS